ncbi:MAG: xanthan lyase [Bacteroidales bacterium]|nr:xanthan lyase [Bacteroidales bacterium]
MNIRSLLISSLLLSGMILLPVNGQKTDKDYKGIERRVMKRASSIPGYFEEWKHMGEVLVDSIQVRKPEQILSIYLSPSATNIPVRTAWLDHLKTELRNHFGRKFRDYDIQLLARGRLMEEYIPNLYRGEVFSHDTIRLALPYIGKALVTRSGYPDFPAGLSGNHISLWPSHGFFFDQQLDRWQWQRARLWETVEDIFTWSFTSDYLVPMLENAGAAVLLPRERDSQIHEVIVDNDKVTGQSQLIVTNGISQWDSSYLKGFMPLDTLYPGQNPFVMGTSLSLVSVPGDSSRVTYVPDIPETGEYAVYVSYGKTNSCMDEARYEVRYSGGTVQFTINQCMGAGTWVYLGTFHFQLGINREFGSVVVYSGNKEGILSSDAVRFGGGMGNVLINNMLSGKPRWMEGSRYYLQFAGMPDSIVYSLNAGKNDYNDDYMSRGEWVNYLIGNSRPQYSEKYSKGFGIPVDLALAFHTDAGVTPNDSIVGTLGIYSAVRNNGMFPNNQSKLASRDLTDIIQTQLVEDFRKQINPDWTRRALWDREYSEAWRPVVPTMLLELLSHQNLADMKYGLDPRFKFLASRAIYKGILRYLALQHGHKAVVQPLPPDHMAIEVIGDLKIKISWCSVADPFENTAVADGYWVYMQSEEKGFDPGYFTRDTFRIITLPEWGKMYSFRVAAMNAGGLSLPGETLSVGLLPGSKKPVLIVNAFDRICAPAFFDKGDMAGIAWWEDEGVANGRNLSYTGRQYDFNRNSDWLNDDSQGWGASNADLETWPVAGNSFSFPAVHGKALLMAGYSFVSVSDEEFVKPNFDAGRYQAIDLIFGEERGTDSFGKSAGKDFILFTPEMRNAITKYTRNGGNLFLSGSYIGTDMFENKDSLAIRFASEVLHYTWRTGHATVIGSVNATNQADSVFPGMLQFNTDYRSSLYRVESPDAIEPSGQGAYRIYRYSSGYRSAGIAFKGTYRIVALGFPFETLLTEEQRIGLISGIMEFFKNIQE